MSVRRILATLAFLALLCLGLTSSDPASLTVNTVGGSLAIEANCANPPAGVTCLGSEPLQNDQVEQLPATGFHDPADSEGASAEEFNAGDALRQLAPLKQVLSFVAVDGTVDPLGQLSGVDRVVQFHRVSGSSNSAQVVDTANQDMTGKTWCHRIYFRDEAGLEPSTPPTDDDLKITSLRSCGSTACPNVSLNWKGSVAGMGAPGTASTGFNYSYGNDSGTPGGSVSFSDCSSGWCRVDLCADHDADDGGPDDNKMQVRARLVDLATCTTRTYGPQTSDDAHATADTGANTFVKRMHCDRDTSQDGACVSNNRYQSFAAAFLKDVDPTFWPPVAAEINLCP